MRISAAGDVPRLDLDTLRRLVAPLRSEWARFEFTHEGWLRDPDTGKALTVLRLIEGRHRNSGARYRLTVGTKADTHCDFLLAGDDGHTVHGTLIGRAWRAELQIAPKPSVTGRVDVGALLRANEVPGCLVSLVGAREATGDVRVDPSALDRRGELVRGHGRAQRAGVRLTADVATRSDRWRGDITVHLAGRGVLGRLALLAFRPAVRRGLRETLTEFWSDAEKEVGGLRADLARMDEGVREAGSVEAWVHRELWTALRQFPAATVPAPVRAPAIVEPNPSTATTHRRYVRPLAITLTPAELARLIDVGRRSRFDEFVLRVRHEHVHARWTARGRYDSPPVFDGRLTQGPDGARLDGQVRESWGNAWYSRLWLFVTVLMMAILAVGIAGLAGSGDKVSLMPLFIGLLGGPIFALFWLSARRDRRPDFEKGATRLATGLHNYLATGSARAQEM